MDDGSKPTADVEDYKEEGEDKEDEAHDEVEERISDLYVAVEAVEDNSTCPKKPLAVKVNYRNYLIIENIFLN